MKKKEIEGSLRMWKDGKTMYIDCDSNEVAGKILNYAKGITEVKK